MGEAFKSFCLLLGKWHNNESCVLKIQGDFGHWFCVKMKVQGIIGDNQRSNSVDILFANKVYHSQKNCFVKHLMGDCFSKLEDMELK